MAEGKEAGKAKGAAKDETSLAKTPGEKAVVTAVKAQSEQQVKPQVAIAEAKAPAAAAEAKPAKPKEADPTKEFVDGIMAEMALKGASKKRLVKHLAEKYGMDKQKVLFRLRRALITERYAAAHEAHAGGDGGAGH